jgi:hypothetical protein
MAALLSSRDQKVVEDRWKMIDGNPRFVLKKGTNLGGLIEGTIGKLTVQKLHMVYSLDVSTEDDIFFQIMHCFVKEDSGYSMPDTDIASQVIDYMVCERFARHQFADVMNLTRQACSLPLLCRFLQREFIRKLVLVELI